MADSQVNEVALKYMVDDKADEQTNRYKAYPEYKDSGVKWLGDIPSGWDKRRLKYIFNIKKRIAGEIGFDVLSVTQKGIKIKDIESGDGQLSMDYSKYQLVYTGDFAMNHMDLLTGYIDISKFDGVTSPDYRVFSIEDKEYYYDRFYLYLLQMGYKQKIFFHLGQGSAHLGRWRLPTDAFYGIEYPVPKKEEQIQIANFLDHETTKIDTLIEKQQRLIELLIEKRQAVISHAVTKGLNPNVLMKESGVEWLGEVPEHWDILKLKHLIKFLESGCSVNAADIPANLNEIGVLKTSCVYTRTFRVEENKTVIPEDLNRVKCPVRKNAIIISRMNTPDLVGASALVKEDVSNIYLPDRLWQTIFDDAYELEPEFLAHFMTIKGFRTQISLAAEGASSSMQNIAKEDYLAINCALPPVNEQKQIVDSINSNIVHFDLLIDKAQKAIQLMQERRTALISSAVTGKIDVRDWEKPE